MYIYCQLQLVTIDRERPISKKQYNKASAEGARLPEEAMLLRDIYKFYKAIPGRASSFWTHQQGLPRANRSLPIALTLTFIKQSNTKHKTYVPFTFE